MAALCGSVYVYVCLSVWPSLCKELIIAVGRVVWMSHSEADYGAQDRCIALQYAGCCTVRSLWRLSSDLCSHYSWQTDQAEQNVLCDSGTCCWMLHESTCLYTLGSIIRRQLLTTMLRCDVTNVSHRAVLVLILWLNSGTLACIQHEPLPMPGKVETSWEGVDLCLVSPSVS